MTKALERSEASADPSTIESNRQRVSRRQVDKFAERRTELADAALLTLGELGYARTSLREIAQNSSFSHGVLHYYFTDKVDLITHCVKQYKAHCVERYDELVDTAESAEQLLTGFASELAATAHDDASMHRLWYDLRSQSMFEPALRPDVLDIDDSLKWMIWRILSRYAQLADARLVVTEASGYAVLDGLFERGLLRHLAGEPDALVELSADVESLLPLLIRPSSVLIRPSSATLWRS